MMNPEKFETYAKVRWQNENTRRQYLLLAKRVLPYWVDGQITQDTINNFQASISHNQSYGNTLYSAFLKSYLDCYQEDIEAAGQSVRVIRPTSRQAKHYGQAVKYKFLTKEDVEYLMEHMPTTQMKVIIRMLFETGLRCSELLNIKNTDIDFGNRIITGVGKGNVKFDVKFSPETQRILIDWYDVCPDPEHPFKMYKRNGKPYVNQPFALWYHMKRQAEQIGIENVHPHRLRHALGYFLRKDMRLDLSQIKTKLRHQDITTTQIYAPATKEEVDDIIDKEVFGVN